jgi:hypothetical protein
MLGQAFSPASINAGDVSTLTVTLSNPNVSVATLTAPLTDVLPSGVVIATPPNASATCGGGTTVTAPSGGTAVTLRAGRSIPANGSCTLTVNVTAAARGSYSNTLPGGALATSNGDNAARAVVTLTVMPPGPTPPTVSMAFSVATINAGGVSTLIVTLSNPNVLAATLTAPLIDILPGVVPIVATPAAGTTGYWFSPVMYCIKNGSNQLIETTTADNDCTGTTVIASNVTAFSATLSAGAGPVDRPVGVVSLTLANSDIPQPVKLTTSVRLGGGTL